jgi:hypothetical protein
MLVYFKNTALGTLLTPSLQVACYSLTLREEHRLRVFENRVLRRISYLDQREMK